MIKDNHCLPAELELTIREFCSTFQIIQVTIASILSLKRFPQI